MKESKCAKDLLKCANEKRRFENITQIKVIYVSVQPLHNRQFEFVIPHKNVELIAWKSKRLEVNYARKT